MLCSLCPLSIAGYEITCDNVLTTVFYPEIGAMSEILHTVSKHSLNDQTNRLQYLAFWLNKTPEERLLTVEILRRQYYEHPPRLQRTARIIQQTQG